MNNDSAFTSRIFQDALPRSLWPHVRRFTRYGIFALAIIGFFKLALMVQAYKALPMIQKLEFESAPWFTGFNSDAPERFVGFAPTIFFPALTLLLVLLLRLHDRIFDCIFVLLLKKAEREGNQSARYGLGRHSLRRAHFDVASRGGQAAREGDTAGVEVETIPGPENRIDTLLDWAAIRAYCAKQWSGLEKRHARRLESLLQSAISSLSAVDVREPFGPDAHYLSGIINLRGFPTTGHGAVSRFQTAIDHLQIASDSGHAAAACELALLLAADDATREQARQMLRASLPNTPISELRNVAMLELARIDLYGTPTGNRDIPEADRLVHELLGIPNTDRPYASPQYAAEGAEERIRLESLSPREVRRAADAIRLAIASESREELKRKEREQARSELYSFITHSIPSAMSTVVAETKDSLEVLRGGAFENDKDYLIRSLSSALGRAAFIDSLMATHRLLVSGHERLQSAWRSESDGPLGNPGLVVIDATKQAIAQTLFTDQNYLQLDIPAASDEKINHLREASLAQLSSRTTTARDSRSFLEYVGLELPFFEIEIDQSIEWSMKPGGIRFGILLSIVSELTRNAIRYRIGQSPLSVIVAKLENGFSVKVRNLSETDEQFRPEGTRRGLLFVREFAAAISELTFTVERAATTHTATLVVSFEANS